MTTSRPYRSGSFGCLDAPRLPPPKTTKIALVRSDKGPSEIHCKTCGLMMMPLVLEYEQTDSSHRVFRTDVWACFICEKHCEVRYAPWIPRTSEGTYDAAP